MDKVIYDINYIVLSSESAGSWSAWVAVFISTLALGGIIWQGYIMRSHNKLSVRPHIAGHSSDLGDYYSLEVRNDGLGPAWITSSRIFYKGVLVEGEGPEVIQRAFSNVEDCNLVQTEFFHSSFVLPAGGKLEVCRVVYADHIKDIDEYLAKLLWLEIDYKNAYNEPCEKFSTRRVGST